MSVATELTKLNTNIKNAYDEIATKGGTIPQNKNTDNLATAISSISGGASIDDYFMTSGNITTASSMIKKIPDITTTSTQISFSYLTNFTEIGNITAPNLTSISISNNSLLTSVGTITAPNITNVSTAFSYNTSLTNGIYLDTSNCTNIRNMYFGCTNLENVPVYDWSSATTISDVFYNCGNLTDQALDNILQSCITATSFTGNKFLRASMGIPYSISASRVTSCPHYAEASALGWTI